MHLHKLEDAAMHYQSQQFLPVGATARQGQSR